MRKRTVSLGLAAAVSGLAMLFAAGCGGGEEVKCEADSCSGHGVCAVEDGKLACQCETGYSGAVCNECAAGYVPQDGECVPECSMDCGAHGHCALQNGSPACACDTGYAGERCGECEPDYQDNDRNGTCLPACAIAGLDCGAHGACADTSGTALCECHKGYAGSTCRECAPGYEEKNGECVSMCTQDCGAHGHCELANGSPSCACDTGYAGADCLDCAADYQDNDHDGTCLAGCAIAGLSCGHGSCDDGDGTAGCACETGYAGDACDGCAGGFQDNDQNGTCLPACPTSGLDCGAHGTCDDLEGTARCICDTGYSGDLCDGCDVGFQDNDLDGTCLPTCATSGLDCGAHGHCDDGGGAARCACDTGYNGDLCDGCDVGFQDNDLDGTCLPTCATSGLDCGADGHCDDGGGVARCACDTGYSGDLCDGCAGGFQDNDLNGTCLPTCATSGLDCGAHGHCDDGGGVARCACDTGYSGDLCDGCAGGFQDNDLNGTCLPTCATSGINCGAHGTCVDSTGMAYCRCAQGYTGDRCELCDQGYQDNDHNGTCLPDCGSSGLQCGAHGHCVDSGGEPACACDTGYTGTYCQFCAQGYQDNDNDGLCAPDCQLAQLNCGTHGHCDDGSGTARCVCDTGYTGSNCASCDTGYQDNNHDGTCLPSCDLLGWSCSNHGVCTDASGSAVCLCDMGYSPDGSGNCLPSGTGRDCQSPLPLDLAAGTVTGNTTGSGSDYTCTCQSRNGEELVYVFSVAQTITATFTTTGFDTVLYLRSECDLQTSEMACDDDSAGNLGSRFTITLSPGTYYLFVDGYSTNSGAFTLTIEVDCPAGTVYNPASGSCVDDPCDPNPCTAAHQHVCQAQLPGYVCDCDPGYIPDPNHPGTCMLDPNPSGESCADPIPLPIGTGSVAGTTTGAANDGTGTCGGAGPDRVYAFTLSTATRADFLMTGYDTVLHLRTVCDQQASQVACNDDSQGTAAGLTRILDPGTYYLFADSYYAAGGSYTLAYDFRTDPCQPDPCPGTPTCQANSDWSGYTCVCPAGTVPFGNDCVDDPCDPNPCTAVPHKTVCVADLPAGHHCQCAVGYIDDGQGGCTMDPNANEWAFFVFLNADNNLESDGYDDLTEMEAAGSTPYVHMVALLDSYSRDGGASRRIYINQGSFTVVDNLGEVDMSDWHTLADFGTWAVQNYPARHYALILWDHGAGWKGEIKNPIIKGFSNDDHGTANEISISNGDYARALQSITAALGGKLDIVGFDACLMGMWEVAEATAPYAHYLVASSETEPAAGWAYDDFLIPLVNNPQMAARDLAISIVDAYYNESTGDSTLAVTDLDTMPALAAAVTSFADALRANTGLYSQFETLRQATQTFYLSEHRDLWDFARRVAATSGMPANIVNAANALIAQLQVSIVYSRAQSDYPNSHGLAVYFPSRSSHYDTAYRDSGAVWSQHATWDDFLMSFAP